MSDFDPRDANTIVVFSKREQNETKRLEGRDTSKWPSYGGHLYVGEKKYDISLWKSQRSKAVLYGAINPPYVPGETPDKSAKNDKIELTLQDYSGDGDRDTSKLPNYKGTASISGEDYDLALWVKIASSGTKYIQGKLSENQPHFSDEQAQQLPKPAADTDFDDDIPF